MKITAVNTYFVRPRWGFVEIITDSGLIGWAKQYWRATHWQF